MTALLISLFFSLTPTTAPSVDAVAADVARVAGADAWKSVKVLRFTCSSGPGLEIKSRVRYEYDRINGRITVSTDEKTASASLATAPADEDATWALAHWRGEGAWMLLPLLITDPDVPVERKPDVMIDGQTFHVLHVRLHDQQPEVQPFDLYVDASSNHIQTSIQILPDGKRLRYTWDFYREFDGIRFCTSHSGSGKKISLSEIQVER